MPENDQLVRIIRRLAQQGGLITQAQKLTHEELSFFGSSDASELVEFIATIIDLAVVTVFDSRAIKIMQIALDPTGQYGGTLGSRREISRSVATCDPRTIIRHEQKGATDLVDFIITSKDVSTLESDRGVPAVSYPQRAELLLAKASQALADVQAALDGLKAL